MWGFKTYQTLEIVQNRVIFDTFAVSVVTLSNELEWLTAALVLVNKKMESINPKGR